MSIQKSPPSQDFSSVIGHALRGLVRPQTYRNLLYLVLMLLLGTLYFTLLAVGFLAGLSLAIVGIGIPLLVLSLILAVELAGLERTLVRRLLYVDIPTPSAKTEATRWNRIKQLVTNRQTWKGVVYLLSEFIFGGIMFGLVWSLLETSMSFLFAPVYYTRAPVAVHGPIPTTELTLDVLFGWDSLLVGLTSTFQLASWQIETLPGALLVAGLGVVLLMVTLQFVNAFFSVWSRYARQMLTTPRYWDIPGW